ncbi:acyl-CoA dehydrogenase [Rhodospirillum rubrum]|uniref:acyl-CoA dehydrogenase family protein n=1 Tax=Rhodospirillum rubrum TaxID=1085 RepID=UPI001906FCC2|nr:acyl-CoA dehydrogenase family protein [Rhodospirillum rubrum]MBK1665881.1 acyl-CoA dehydrogenase [Rhodospirillum rubrum]MBK1678004.1 acyl-CoA dehydrogenase [Rhodospirillum rubrum]
MNALPKAAAKAEASQRSLILPDLLYTCDRAYNTAAQALTQIRSNVAALVSVEDKIDGGLLEIHQHAAHGLAWFATYVEALGALLDWAHRLEAKGGLGELESLILQGAYSEYLHQIFGGLPMSQGEFARLADFGIEVRERGLLQTPYTTLLREHGFSAPVKARIAALIADGHFGDPGLEDETLTLVREQFRRFAEDKVVPHCHEWHLSDTLIPLDVIAQMAEMGVFGLTVAEEYGGLGMGKTAMCVVTEELSRAYIGVGSLGTRSEIAAELISLGGTEEQKRQWLPRLASGEILPTAVFTEPNTGSDLASLRSRAERDGDTYRVTGAKTWITHAARSDLMTLLVRTNPQEGGYKGLSMLLAEKPRGTDEDPFPAKGMAGGEIKVLGYRGMKEYELSFDGFEVPAANLLGSEEGQGFKQLMATFESARIQTAARAVGVAQNAMEVGLRYAQDRVQFGKPLYAFPRVHGKLAWMAVETMVARQLTYRAGREKDSGRRCDIEAGMAKLLAARVAWSNADNALQVHGGNGYAEEYPISRILCDARILNIFEGAAEIQAHVIARGLLSR